MKITKNDIQNIVYQVLLETLIIEKKDSAIHKTISKKINKRLYKENTLFEYIYNAVRKTTIDNRVNLSIYNKVDDATKSSIIRYMSVFCTLDICTGNIVDGYYKIGKRKNEKMMPYEYAKKYINAHDSTVGKFNINKDVVRSKLCTTSNIKIQKAEHEIQKEKDKKTKNK